MRASQISKRHCAKRSRVAAAALALTLVGFPQLSRELPSSFAYAQELTVDEKISELSELAPLERDLSAESLTFGAEVALTRWTELEADPAARSFDAYFEVFREVARIESVEHAAQVSGVDGTSKLASMASKAAVLRAEMRSRGLTGRDAGIAALKTLISSSDRSVFSGDPDIIRVRYTLILDYLSGIDIARLSIELAVRLSEAKLHQLSTDIYADFLPLYYEKFTSEQERGELLELAAGNAHLVGNPAVLRVLGDLLVGSPREEKASLARMVFEKVDLNFLKSAYASASGTAERTLAAWLHGVEVANGRQPQQTLDQLSAGTSQSLDPRAFELLTLSVEDEAERGRIVGEAVLKDIENGYSLIAYQKAVNLGLSPEAATDAYLTLTESLASAGYSNYVRVLASEVRASVTSGELTLNEAQTAALLRSVELVRDPSLVLEIAGTLPGATAVGEVTALRAKIRAVFSMPVDQAIGAQPIAFQANAPKALAFAAGLIDGSESDWAQIGKLSASSADDVALLSQVSARLWQYAARRNLLIEALSADGDMELKEAVAIGVTAFAGFDVSRGAGAEFAVALEKLLPSMRPENRPLLAASIGKVPDASKLNGEALARYSRYVAATGRSLKHFAEISKEGSSKVAEAEAVFASVNAASAGLKANPDYLERVTGFRRLAEARAAVLDRKGWLNSATPPAASAPPVLDFSGTSATSDGRLVVASPRQDGLPAAAAPFMPNLLLGPEAVASRIPVPALRESNESLAGISKRGETRATRLIRFSSEHFDEIINLGVREYLFLNAASSTPRVIFVTRGVVTMSDLVAQVAATDPDAITFDGNVVTLNVPLAVNDGATLIVSGREIKELRLNTRAGAFIINSGKLYFDGVSVTSFDDRTGKPSYVTDHEKGIFFRPFILGWSGSETFAANSRFVALGYAGGRTYGMSLSSGSTDTIVRQVQAAPPTGYFINNSFENLYYGFYAFEAKDIVFVGNELVNGVIYGLDPHDRSTNLRMAYNTAYGTQKKHGIIISREVDDSFILGNLSFENHGSGIMLDRLSYGTIVYANDASRNEGDGFSAMESPCALVDSNVFSANGRAGVKVRNSWDIHVEGNQIRGNAAAGIEAYIDNLVEAEKSEFRDFEEDPFYPIATIAARDNVIEKNGVGLSTRGASEAMFFRNKFIDQLPRYAGGDLKPLGLDIIARSMESGVSVRSVCMPKIPVDKECSLSRRGIIFAQSAQPGFAGADAAANYCVDTIGSPQAAAFNPQTGN
ncbi:right-handed parallel beta-helix repeat-containing protein [Sinorhizobium sp. BJ1]|uniref:right-handed parallel beta-helix repeat-containing protein n=1 Tax=Sinorhizobium sp. BJ1 TaxID=2035455 RepID=UPI000BEAD9B6|nr:right-handed parallel beta-helix repeat-containing protein [Sinorhizobium sp. BJ1]PDT80348.1 hypothetical protein CO676_28110 [Sinorhizobium sp. BJ1]